MTDITTTTAYIDQKKAHDAAHPHWDDGFFGRRSEYLPEFVYGWIDGIVTTFAVVAWATWAGLDISVVMILWFANLLADGLSMSIWSYLSTKSEKEAYAKAKTEEAREVEEFPLVEKEEIREIYAEKWFEGELLDQVVDVIVSNDERRVDVMLKEELNMVEPDTNPIVNGTVTFISFVIVGLFPLVTYVLYYRGVVSDAYLFEIAIVVSAIAFIGIGRLKSYVNKSNLAKSILETLALGLIAALVSYYVGDLIALMVG